MTLSNPSSVSAAIFHTVPGAVHTKQILQQESSKSGPTKETAGRQQQEQHRQQEQLQVSPPLVVIQNPDQTPQFATNNMEKQIPTTPVQQTSVLLKPEVKVKYETSHDISPLTQEKSWTKKFFKDFKNLIADPIKKYIQELFESFKKALGLKGKTDEASYESESPGSQDDKIQASGSDKQPPLLIRDTNATGKKWTNRMDTEMQKTSSGRQP